MRPRCSHLALAGALVLALASTQCSRSHDTTPAAAPGPAPDPSWKRGHALEADLMLALQLSDDQLCTELGTKKCADVHRVLYGEDDPFGSGLYKPFDEPLATTPLAVERLVLSACLARVGLDAAPGATPQVFAGLDLSTSTPLADGRGLEPVVVALYQRLLARDPSAAEIAVGTSLAAGRTPRDFSTLACFAIGSQAEFLFY